MMTSELVRPPPHSVEAEQGVLGSIMLGGGDVVDEARAKLNESAFYVPAHQLIFFTLCIMRDNLMQIDLITVTNTLRDQGYLDQVGGPAKVTEFFTFVPTAANVDYYIGIVREKYMLREIIRNCTEGVRRAYEDQNDAQGVLADVQGRIIDIGQLSSTVEALKPIGDSIPEVIAGLEATFHNRGKLGGMTTGFVDLDRMMGGFQKAKKYYFGARPGMGKSSLATEFAEHLAIENAERDIPVAIFSVEMTTTELAEVILCRRAKIDLVRLRDGFFSKEANARLLAEGERLKHAPIYIDDTPSLSLFEFKARARRAVLKLGARLLIVDYVQLMRSTSKQAQRSREQELTEITQGISATAKELKVPVVVLAQLNRKNEERADKVPILSDFRESGSLEQEADFVGLLHRPSYYCKTETKLENEAKAAEMDVEEYRELAQLIIAKNRRGPTDTMNLRFIKQYAHFESEDEDRPLHSNRPEERQEKDE